MKNLNESLLDSIELIEEMEIKSELDVIIAIGNQYAKVGMISEYAETDPNEYDIIQESTLFMEANAAKEGASKASKVWEKIRKVFHAIFKAIKKACMWIAKQFKKLGKGIKNIFTGKDDKKKDKSKEKEKAEKLVEDLKKTIDECKDKKEDEISDSDINKVIHQAESTVKQVKQIIMSASPEVKQAAAALAEGQKKGNNRINDEIAKAYREQQNKKDSDDKKEPQIEDKGEAKSSAKEDKEVEKIINDLEQYENDLRQIDLHQMDRYKQAYLNKIYEIYRILKNVINGNQLWSPIREGTADRATIRKIIADAKKKNNSKQLRAAFAKLKAQHPGAKGTLLVLDENKETKQAKYGVIYNPLFLDEFLSDMKKLAFGNFIKDGKPIMQRVLKSNIYGFEKMDASDTSAMLDNYVKQSNSIKEIEKAVEQIKDSGATFDEFVASNAYKTDGYDVWRMLEDQVFPKITEATNEMIAYGSFVYDVLLNIKKTYNPEKSSGSGFHLSEDD